MANRPNTAIASFLRWHKEQRTENRGQKTEVRGQRTEFSKQGFRFRVSDISQKITENRGQTIDKVFHPPVFTI
jgi:hypothetical protein